MNGSGRCAIYARYSSREQDGTSTIESQMRECRNYARQHGLLVVEDALFVDRAIPGTSAEPRDSFQTMIAAAQRTPKPFDTILVWKFSRFARNREDSAIYKGLLRRRGVEVISITEPVDAHSATGKLIEGMIEVVDEFYSARLAEEVRRGQTQTALEGYSTGARAPYGYRRREVPDSRGRLNRAGNPVHRITLEIEPTEARVIHNIFEMYASGAGYTKIAKTLNAEGVPGPRGTSWDPGAIRAMLLNHTYRGARVYGRIRKVRTATGTRSKRNRPRDSWTCKEGAHPAIIDTDLWGRVQRKREAVAATLRASGGFGTTRRTQTRFLLTGILHCASCGANFIARMAHSKRFGKYYYYGCAHHARRGDTVCPNRTLLPQEEVERELLDILQQQLLTPDTLERLLKAVNAKLRAQVATSRPRVSEVRKALALVERQIANYTRAIARGDFASLESALRAAEQRRAALQTELAKLDGKQQTTIIQLTPAALEHRLQGMTEKLQSGVKGKVREAIEQSVARVLVGVDGSLTVESKPGGLLGLEQGVAHMACEEGANVLDGIVSRVNREWRVNHLGEQITRQPRMP